MAYPKWRLSTDRYFDPDPAQRRIARELFGSVADLPIISPHGHVDPRLFIDEDATFGTPAETLVIPDHYVFRLLYSQGIRLEDLGIPAQTVIPVEQDRRKIWQLFADHFYLFSGTPTGAWLNHEFVEVFGVDDELNSANAVAIYEELQKKLNSPDFLPRTLFERFNRFENEYQIDKDDYPKWFNAILDYWGLKWKWDTTKIPAKIKIVKTYKEEE